MPSETDAERRKRARVITNRLRKAHPDTGTALHHASSLELLIATILSAQCTDERVNKVTPALFARYATAADFAEADRTELEELVRTTGFYRNKAKSIQGATRKIVEEFGGEVPQTMEELLRLPGVARKTANVVLGNYFGIAAGVVVDTHVFRLAHRMGFTTSKNTGQVEADLMRLVPEKEWIDLGNLLIRHGRTVCPARRPKCEACTLESHYPKVDVTRAPEKKKAGTPRPPTPLGERIRAARKTKKKSQ